MTVLTSTDNADEGCSHEDAIAIGNGCGPVLEAVVSCIADEGDVILVPSPYYHAFSIGL